MILRVTHSSNFFSSFSISFNVFSISSVALAPTSMENSLRFVENSLWADCILANSAQKVDWVVFSVFSKSCKNRLSLKHTAIFYSTYINERLKLQLLIAIRYLGVPQDRNDDLEVFCLYKCKKIIISGG